MFQKICSAQDEAGIIKRKHILRFVDASFSWMEGGPTILQNLTMNIPNGELTVIIGDIKHVSFRSKFQLACYLTAGEPF